MTTFRTFPSEIRRRQQKAAAVTPLPHRSLPVAAPGLEQQRSPGLIPPAAVSHEWNPSRNRRRSAAAYQGTKRALDIVFASTGLLLLSPLFAFIALLVRLDSPGPIFHRRRVLARQTWDGREETLQSFDAFKFRTMHADADEYLRQRPDLWTQYQKNFKLENDPRVTRLGRWLRRASLDELPQLVNVLRGQMSLVGPRILTAEELCRYDENGSALLSVLPGLTGLWQVNGRQTLSYDERVRLDTVYLANRCLRLDIEILLKTVECVLSQRGAC